MPPDDDDTRRPRIPDSLTFSQAQVNHILGVSLAQIYQTLLESPLPDRLQALISQLDGVLAAQAAAPGHDGDEHDDDEHGGGPDRSGPRP
ncbi:MAG: hypothetical protein ABW026_15570 [Microvirga sp.]